MDNKADLRNMECFPYGAAFGLGLGALTILSAVIPSCQDNNTISIEDRVEDVRPTDITPKESILYDIKSFLFEDPFTKPPIYSVFDQYQF